MCAADSAAAHGAIRRAAITNRCVDALPCRGCIPDSGKHTVDRAGILGLVHDSKLHVCIRAGARGGALSAFKNEIPD